MILLPLHIVSSFLHFKCDKFITLLETFSLNRFFKFIVRIVWCLLWFAEERVVLIFQNSAKKTSAFFNSAKIVVEPSVSSIFTGLNFDKEFFLSWYYFSTPSIFSLVWNKTNFSSGFQSFKFYKFFSSLIYY